MSFGGRNRSYYIPLKRNPGNKSIFLKNILDGIDEIEENDEREYSSMRINGFEEIPDEEEEKQEDSSQKKKIENILDEIDNESEITEKTPKNNNQKNLRFKIDDGEVIEKLEKEGGLNILKYTNGIYEVNNNLKKREKF